MKDRPKSGSSSLVSFDSDIEKRATTLDDDIANIEAFPHRRIVTRALLSRSRVAIVSSTEYVLSSL